MKKPLLYLLILSCIISAHQTKAQQTSKDVTTILRASLAAQAGQTVINDLTVNGRVGVAADEETASFSFKGTLAGSTRTDINLSTGTLTEIETFISPGGSGKWSKGSGSQHTEAGHNLMTDPAWCSPVLIIERLLADQKAVVSYVSTENGLAHFMAFQPAPAQVQGSSATLVSHLSQIDIYLDSKTFLPAKYSFATHPDNDALTDIPVSVEYSNYQVMGGITVPTHVQRLLNETLALDLQVGSVAVNTGLSSASF